MNESRVGPKVALTRGRPGAAAIHFVNTHCAAQPQKRLQA